MIARSFLLIVINKDENIHRFKCNKRGTFEEKKREREKMGERERDERERKERERERGKRKRRDRERERAINKK